MSKNYKKIYREKLKKHGFRELSIVLNESLIARFEDLANESNTSRQRLIEESINRSLMFESDIAMAKEYAQQARDAWESVKADHGLIPSSQHHQPSEPVKELDLIINQITAAAEQTKEKNENATLNEQFSRFKRKDDHTGIFQQIKRLED